MTRLAKKLLAALAVGMTLGIGMNANAGLFGLGGMSWKEEVLLHDGRRIIVERTADRHGRHEIGQRPPIGDQSISFTMPGTNQHVVWKDEYSNNVSGANFNMMLLNIVGDTPYLVVTPAGCLSYNKWGRPNPPYVIFKYLHDEWRRISLEDLPIEIKQPNLLNSSPDDVAGKRSKDGLVSAAVIREENDGFRQPEYRTILREPLLDVGGRCGEMIYDGNGGWTGIGWFKKQPTKEACLAYCGREKIGARYCPCETLFRGK